MKFCNSVALYINNQA